jgi:hypothetical protein
MGRLLTGLGGAFGLAWLWRFLRREQASHEQAEPADTVDPAAELRARLEQARETVDDRDEFDAAEGQPVDEVERPPVAEVEAEPEEPTEAPLSLDERRRAIHDKAQQALGEMNRPGESD